MCLNDVNLAASDNGLLPTGWCFWTNARRCVLLAVPKLSVWALLMISNTATTPCRAHTGNQWAFSPAKSAGYVHIAMCPLCFLLTIIKSREDDRRSSMQLSGFKHLRGGRYRGPSGSIYYIVPKRSAMEGSDRFDLTTVSTSFDRPRQSKFWWTGVQTFGSPAPVVSWCQCILQGMDIPVLYHFEFWKFAGRDSR